MSFVLPPDSEPAAETDAVIDPSRRAFFARLATVAAAGLLLKPEMGIGWDDVPPPLSRPRWPSYPPQYPSRPPIRLWSRPQSRPWRPPPSPSGNPNGYWSQPSPGWSPSNRYWDQPQPQSWDQPWAAADLNTRVERYVKHLRLTGRIRPDERTAWLVYDFVGRRFLVKVNAGSPYQSASMIKPFIALAYFQKVQQGEFDYTPYDRYRMEAMIQRSDNRATNYFIDLLNQTSHRSGPAEAEHTIKRNNPGMFRQTRIVEYIPRGGRSYRNRASALDYHRFLQALWYDQVPYADELRRLMYLPNRDRVYTGAIGVPRGTQVIDKTGTTARLCGDMGILVAQGRDGRSYPYTFIGIIQKARPAANYGAWMNARGNVIRDISSMTYSHLRQTYDLV